MAIELVGHEAEEEKIEAEVVMETFWNFKAVLAIFTDS